MRIICLFVLVWLGISLESKAGDTLKDRERYSVTYSYDDGIRRKEIHVEEPPRHAVSLSHFMTEILLALGLEDSMAATALLNEPVLPQYQEAYSRIPVLQVGEGHSVSKEAFLSTGVDFVAGWEQSISEESTGSLDELVSRGISPFVVSAIKPYATIEDVYSDIELVAKIFDVEDRGAQVVDQMKAEVAGVEEKVGKLTGDRPRVLIYDSGEGEAFVGGGGLPSDLVKLAGGENIFRDLSNDYGLVSFESIVERNPQVIVVTDYYAGIPAREKVRFLRSHPALREVDAVKNNRIYIVGLADIAPGIRNGKTVIKLFDCFYGNGKK